MSERIIVNGADREVGDGSLLEVLRRDLGLTGAKPACGEGACGACTVLLDDEPVRACVTPAAAAAGRSVTTIEGIAHEGKLHPLQEAFIAAGAIQCGFCTPGMVISAAALLARNPSPSAAEVREALAGNVCRCCAYAGIERAVLSAAGNATATAGTEPRTASFWEFRPHRPWDRCAPEEREYFELLGDGLVVVLPQPEAPSAFGGDRGGAWLHVGPDGEVTAFAGKVDVGQDNRSALSLIVAEELGVPPDSVALVMGDTDLCPFDFGTFGSRSVPDNGRDLRLCAARARELLDGEPLAAGARRIGTATHEAPVTAPADRPRSGHRAPRAGGRSRVTGALRYPIDLVRPGMLQGAILRAPAYGSTLIGVDLDAARAVENAVAVHEEDMVAVAAPDRVGLERALAALAPRWEPPPEPPSEEELASHLRSHPAEGFGWQAAVEREEGDVEAALAGGAAVVAATYETAYVAHAALEPRVAIAEWDDRGRLTVWTGTQTPFFDRYALAAALGVDEEHVRVIVPDTGGGFGGKHTETEALAAARLARAAKRPVRVALSREEEFRHTHLRPAAVIDVRVAAMSDGTLAAIEQRNINSGSQALDPPYRTDAIRVSFQPAQSPLPQGSYRALAATANTFARESALDELAHELGADPLELRLRNMAEERLAHVLRTAAEHAGWPGPGLGLAAGLEKEGRVATVAQVRVDDSDVELVRIVTAYDCGAILNRATVEAQVEGAIAMGLGGALFEAVRFADARMLNATMHTYRVPRITDVPPIEVVLVDRPDVPPAGAGEAPIIAVAPAIANAIFAASGVRLRSLPLLPDGRLPEPAPPPEPAP